MRVPYKELHAVKGRGGVVTYHYVFRGGPRFWRSGDSAVGSPEYHAAYARALATVDLAKPAKGQTTGALVDRWLISPEFTRLADRTQRDYRLWARRFIAHFGDLPQQAWEDPRARRDLIEWRDKWGASPKQADYAVTVAVLILNWARDRTEITVHNCDRIAKLYRSDRAEIVWTPEDVAAFMRVAPEPARRIVVAAIETGLRPGDLIGLSRQHIQATTHGRRLLVRTRKRRRMASVPVSPEMAAVIDATPSDRLLILVSAKGRPLTEQRVSQYVGYWMRQAGLRDELTLYDARGTAATKLLRMGLSLGEIAAFMGWSPRYAAGVIEHYAAVAPELADEILIKLQGTKPGRIL